MQHLREKGEDSGLTAVITFSSSWDAHTTMDTLEKPTNWFLYNRHLTGILVKYIKKYEYNYNKVKTYI